MKLSEKSFSEQVVALARMKGWRVAHFTQGMTPRGTWVTPVKADGAGFPDLVLVRERVIFAELKAKSGTLRPAQVNWAIWLAGAMAEQYLWYPADWPDIQKVLHEIRPPMSV